MAISDQAGRRLHRILSASATPQIQEPGSIQLMGARNQLIGYVPFNENRFMLDVLDVLRKSEAYLANVPQRTQLMKPTMDAFKKLKEDLEQDGTQAVIAPNATDLPLEDVPLEAVDLT